MKVRIIAISFLCLFSLASQAKSIAGKWKTVNESGKTESIVEIFKKGGKYYGNVVEIFDPKKKKNVCDLCTDHRKNKPVQGMEIIRGLVFDSNDSKYSNGDILDPNNGKVYDCKMWLENKNTLKVRGYIAFFFRTQTWLRVN